VSRHHLTALSNKRYIGGHQAAYLNHVNNLNIDHVLYFQGIHKLVNINANAK